MKPWLTTGLAGALMIAGGAGCGTMSRPDRNPEAAPAVSSDTAPGPVENAAEARPFVRRVHLKFRSEQEVAEYLALDAKKQAVAADYKALGAGLVDKAAEIRNVKDELSRTFKIEPDRQYAWDDGTRTILEVKADGNGGVTNVAVFKMADEAAENAFKSLLAKKQKAMQEASFLQAGMTRREYDLNQLQRVLAAEYSLSRDREYELDPKTRILYEKVNVPKRFKVEGK